MYGSIHICIYTYTLFTGAFWDPHRLALTTEAEKTYVGTKSFQGDEHGNVEHWPIEDISSEQKSRYCWWKNSCTSWYGKYDVNMPLFAGFHRCQVVQDFFHQHYHQLDSRSRKATAWQPWTKMSGLLEGLNEGNFRQDSPTYALVNDHIAGITLVFKSGNTSSIRVHFPAMLVYWSVNNSSGWSIVL